MDDNDNPVLVYTTCPSMEEARRIGGDLVERKFAACANILPGMQSIYMWQGERKSDEEVVLLLKTRQARRGDVIREVERLHPYETPAVLAFPAAGVSHPFAAWIAEETS